MTAIKTNLCLTVAIMSHLHQFSLAMPNYDLSRSDSADWYENYYSSSEIDIIEPEIEPILGRSDNADLLRQVHLRAVF